MYNHRHHSCGHVFQGRYKAFVVEEAAARAVLGSERFTDHLRRGLNDLKQNLDIRRESSQHRRLSAWQSLESVVAAVGRAYGSGTEELLRRHNRNCEARQVLLYLAATLCRGRYSLAELGQRLGPVSLAAVSNARAKMARRLQDDQDLSARVEAIATGLRTKDAKDKLED